jgi:hypothetical protein
VGEIRGTEAEGHAGVSVSISEDGTRVAYSSTTLVDSSTAYGYKSIVHVYDHNAIDNSFTQIGSVIEGEVTPDDKNTKMKLSADGTHLITGAAKYNFSTASFSSYVRVFKLMDATWTRVGSADITGESSGFPEDVSVDINADGSKILVGFAKENFSAGEARLYTWDSVASSWLENANVLTGRYANDELGRSVSLQDTGFDVYVAVSSPGFDNTFGDSNQGAVEVYKLETDQSWTMVGSRIIGESSGDKSGNSISLRYLPASSSLRLAIGATYNDGNGVNAGHVRVYEYSGTSWAQLGSDLNGERGEVNYYFDGDRFGYSVDMSSDGLRVAVGSPFNYYYQGHVIVYGLEGGDWKKVSTDDIDGSSNQGEEFGYSVALSGDGELVLIGAPANDYYAENSGTIRLYKRDERSDAPSVSPSSIEDRTFTIQTESTDFDQSNNKKWCVSVESATYLQPVKVRICSSANRANQEFHFDEDAVGNYRIRLRSNAALCLVSLGRKLFLDDCQESVASKEQVFEYSASENALVTYKTTQLSPNTKFYVGYENYRKFSKLRLFLEGTTNLSKNTWQLVCQDGCTWS